MFLKIMQVGAPVLRQKARPLDREEILSDEIQSLIRLMQATMWEAPGVGLAAPQVGVSLQLIVIEDKKDYHKNATAEQLQARERTPVPFHVLINPKLTITSTETPAFYEGCLSFSGFVGMVPRAFSVRVEAFNEKAEPVTIEARGWYARILQHECDHLEGTLCVDKMDVRTLTTIENYTK